MFVFSCLFFTAVVCLFSRILLLLRDEMICENIIFEEMELGDNYVSIQEFFQSDDETVV